MIAENINSNESSLEQNSQHNSKGENSIIKNFDKNNTDKKERPSLKNLLVFTLVIVTIVLPIRMYIAKPFIVSGTSMFPTFNTWNYLLVDQLTYRFSQPQRGDVIVFRYPQKPSKFFIKRIIGLPNETLELSGTTVTIINNENKDGFVLNEPYVSDENQKENSMTTTLGDNEYFVMGDNRKVSFDSRYWGPLEDNKITGRAYIRLFPFTSIEVLPGKAQYKVTSEQ